MKGKKITSGAKCDVVKPPFSASGTVVPIISKIGTTDSYVGNFLVSSLLGLTHMKIERPHCAPLGKYRNLKFRL
jgi:hypothetical protein